MPLLRVNATASGIAMHNSSRPVASCLALHRAKPALIMVHGYKYAPGRPGHCPHRRIFAQTGADSWPEGLNLDSARMLGIAFGWSARGRLHRIHQHAQACGRDLADLVRLLRQQAPGRPVHLIAHSMGATLALSALSHLRQGDIGRIVLLSGACHLQAAHRALETPAGRVAELVNLTSRENDLFDFAFECLVPGGRTIGQGIAAPNVLNIQIDCPQTLAQLATLGHMVAPPVRRVCHWSSYTRDGIMAFNARVLGDPDLRLAAVRQALPARTHARWSRLCPNAQEVRSGIAHLAEGFKRRIMRHPNCKDTRHENAY